MQFLIIVVGFSCLLFEMDLCCCVDAKSLILCVVCYCLLLGYIFLLPAFVCINILNILVCIFSDDLHDIQR